MKKTIIHSSQVPLPGNSTSQAVGFGGLFFLSGQVALDPYHHRLIEDASARDETQRVLENVRTLLLASGLDMAHVLKTTLYVKNMSDVSRVDEVYAEFFPMHPPARTVVEVSRLPHDALIAIDVIAAAPVALVEPPSDPEPIDAASSGTKDGEGDTDSSAASDEPEAVSVSDSPDDKDGE